MLTSGMSTNATSLLVLGDCDDEVIRSEIQPNMVKPEQYGHHFADNIFKCIFIKENFCILNQIWPKFVPKGPISKQPALLQVMVWCCQATRHDQAPVPLSIFRSNSKLDENSKHSSVKCTRPITTIFCTRHDSVTVVTCAKYRCDRSSIFETRAFWILCLVGRAPEAMMPKIMMPYMVSLSHN